MGNPLLTFRDRLFGPDEEERRRAPVRSAAASSARASEAIFLVLRRMRAPLTLLITRALSTLLFVDSALEYVVSGRRVPASWIWRELSRAPAEEPASAR